LSDPATLLTPSDDPFTTGAAEYYDSPFPGTIPAEPRIYIRIELADLGFETLAMVDTGAPWCILEPGLANLVRKNFEDPRRKKQSHDSSMMARISRLAAAMASRAAAAKARGSLRP